MEDTKLRKLQKAAIKIIKMYRVANKNLVTYTSCFCETFQTFLEILNNFFSLCATFFYTFLHSFLFISYHTIFPTNSWMKYIICYLILVFINISNVFVLRCRGMNNIKVEHFTTEALSTIFCLSKCFKTSHHHNSWIFTWTMCTFKTRSSCHRRSWRGKS